ncbi:MAG: hypothetical protein JWQ21_2199 [Herminiimonas sp.]|nr:hypothetical protein [Herminiimonas sp.]
MPVQFGRSLLCLCPLVRPVQIKLHQERTMKLSAIFFVAMIWSNDIASKDSSDVLVESVPHSVPFVNLPERFSGVTADNGQAWIDQCDGAAQKSDNTARVEACLSFLQTAIASRRKAKGSCPDVLSPGAFWISTFQIARRYPRLSIKKIFAIAFDSIEPASCGKPL